MCTPTPNLIGHSVAHRSLSAQSDWAISCPEGSPTPNLIGRWWAGVSQGVDTLGADGRVRHARRARSRPRARRPARASRGIARTTRSLRGSGAAVARGGGRPRGRAGIERLYSHQAAAIDLLRAGRSVAIATGTASGKSLCYQVPDRRVGRDRPPRHRAARSSRPRPSPTISSGHCARGSFPGCAAVTFDGDTTTDDRAWARKNANVVLTNPDMLHVGILPSHQRWATFMMRLRYVVVDELHTQRGIFGSHVAHVLRRLRRVCEHYGAEPDLLLRERDDRQPGRARERAVRSPGGADRRRRVATLGADRSRAGNARCSTSTRAPAHRPTYETAELPRPLRARRAPDARVHAQPARRRARRATRARGLLEHLEPGLGTARRRVPRRLPRRRSGARSSSSSRAGGCSASRPPTRSSSASTSAASTRSCSTASPARSRRCGSRPAAPAAPTGAPPRCSSPATTSSTSGTSTHPSELTGTRSPNARS